MEKKDVVENNIFAALGISTNAMKDDPKKPKEKKTML